MSYNDKTIVDAPEKSFRGDDYDKGIKNIYYGDNCDKAIKNSRLGYYACETRDY